MTDAANSVPDWKSLALAEIASVKEQFILSNQWKLTTDEAVDRVMLFVRLRHKQHPERVKVLRLVYGPGFPRERPREGFVDPENHQDEGFEFWIDDGDHAFKRNRNPMVICLEGTWGFHQDLHKERDPMRASLNKLLLEIQACFDQTP